MASRRGGDSDSRAQDAGGPQRGVYNPGIAPENCEYG